MPTVNGDDSRQPLVRGVLVARRIKATRRVFSDDVDTMIEALLEVDRQIPVLFPCADADADAVIQAIERVRDTIAARSGDVVSVARPEMLIGAFLAEDGTHSCIAALSAITGWGSTVLDAVRALEASFSGGCDEPA